MCIRDRYLRLRFWLLRWRSCLMPVEAMTVLSRFCMKCLIIMITPIFRQERRGVVIIEHQELGLMPTGQLPITIQITGLIYLFLLQAYRIPLSLIPTITKPMLIAVKAPG